MKTIETKRCILREWQESDAKDLYAYAKSPLVGPNAGWKPHENAEESKQIIQMFMNQNDTWAIVDKECNCVIGSVGLHKSHKEGYTYDYELGYVLSHEYWGKGIICEVCHSVLAFAFDELNSEKIIVSHFFHNMRSKRVIEKLGFHYVGELHESYQVYDGSKESEKLYFMNKEEWQNK